MSQNAGIFLIIQILLSPIARIGKSEAFSVLEFTGGFKYLLDFQGKVKSLGLFDNMKTKG